MNDPEPLTEDDIQFISYCLGVAAGTAMNRDDDIGKWMLEKSLPVQNKLHAIWAARKAKEGK
jgi:hypothetical protein